MINFSKSVFYLVCSFVVISSYFAISTHLQNIEIQKKERKERLDEYYLHEFEVCYFIMHSEDDYEYKKLARESLEEAQKNAYYDGYGKADVEIMKSKAYSNELSQQIEYLKMQKEENK